MFAIEEGGQVYYMLNRDVKEGDELLSLLLVFK
jgi:hypothetical protein